MTIQCALCKTRQDKKYFHYPHSKFVLCTRCHFVLHVNADDFFYGCGKLPPFQDDADPDVVAMCQKGTDDMSVQDFFRWAGQQGLPPKSEKDLLHSLVAGNSILKWFIFQGNGLATDVEGFTITFRLLKHCAGVCNQAFSPEAIAALDMQIIDACGFPPDGRERPRRQPRTSGKQYLRRMPERNQCLQEAKGLYALLETALLLARLSEEALEGTQEDLPGPDALVARAKKMEKTLSTTLGSRRFAGSHNSLLSPQHLFCSFLFDQFSSRI
eukprot:scaffold244_cov172-Amphora_coffeaeformis.AAC.9